MKRMKVEVLGVERRRRWRDDEKRRIVAETLEPSATITEVARRNGVAVSLVFTWRRLAREGRLGDLAPPSFLPVQILDSDRSAKSSIDGDDEKYEEAGDPIRRRKALSRHGLIEIDLGRRGRVRVDADVDADALRRVLDVLAKR